MLAAALAVTMASVVAPAMAATIFDVVTDVEAAKFEADDNAIPLSQTRSVFTNLTMVYVILQQLILKQE
jgi:hypothetical protein